MDDDSQAVIVIEADEAQYIHRAVQDMVSDVQKMTGKTIEIHHQPIAGKSNLIIGTIGQSRLLPDGYDSLAGTWERYALQTRGNDLIIAGSNPRGTMFGVYYFIENYLGIDPFYWWKDFEPEKGKAWLSKPFIIPVANLTLNFGDGLSTTKTCSPNGKMAEVRETSTINIINKWCIRILPPGSLKLLSDRAIT
ncbi:MAG: hypothetical protein HC819_16825 [Cyclobacteriaceae bacterium]|nr:hypothetical protein [Cyclobacteriaceae bacterium]